MKSVMVSLVLGAGALVASAASAAPLSAGPVMLPDSGIENVRLVCDDLAAATAPAVAGEWSFRNTATATITVRGSVTSRVLGITAADTTMMDPVWGSASDRAASVSELGLARAGNLSLKEGRRKICGLRAGWMYNEPCRDRKP